MPTCIPKYSEFRGMSLMFSLPLYDGDIFTYLTVYSICSIQQSINAKTGKKFSPLLFCCNMFFCLLPHSFFKDDAFESGLFILPPLE